MKGYLLKNYGLNKSPLAPSRLTLGLKRVIKNPMYYFIIFGIIMLIIGNLSVKKVLPYSLSTGLATTFAYSIASVGFCLLMGYSGLASLGTGGFIGIGTYSIYYVMTVANLPFIFALVAAVGIAVVIGAIVGFISLRIEGIYLCILTLGLSEILRNLFVVLQDTIISSKFYLFGNSVQRSSGIFIVTVALVIVMIITQNIINSPTGRAMLAMKNSTSAAQAMGVSLMKYRLTAFIICTVYASLTGIMLMIVIRAAQASNSAGFYALITSLNILAAVIIGGYRSVWGAVFGTFIMYGLQTVLLSRVQFFVDNPVVITFISGILVILVVMFYPGGAAQLVREAKNGIKKLIRKIKECRYGKDI